MDGPGDVILAINFSTDAAPERCVPEQDWLWETLLAEYRGGEIRRNIAVGWQMITHNIPSDFRGNRLKSTKHSCDKFFP